MARTEIFLVGLGAGGLIYWRTPPDTSANNDDASFSSSYDSRRFEQKVERNAGTFGVLSDKFVRAFALLGEPRPLAMTIIFVSIVAAGGCFVLASIMAREESNEPDESTRPE